MGTGAAPRARADHSLQADVGDGHCAAALEESNDSQETQTAAATDDGVEGSGGEAALAAPPSAPTGCSDRPAAVELQQQQQDVWCIELLGGSDPDEAGGSGSPVPNAVGAAAEAAA